MIAFTSPQYGPALLVFPMLAFLLLRYYRWQQQVKRNIGESAVLSTAWPAQSNTVWRYGWRLVALLCLAIAVMGPVLPGKTATTAKKGLDWVLAIDVSNSMLAMDLRPTRLDRAKQLAIELIQQRPEDRVAILLFAGHPYLQMPLTNDPGLAMEYIAAAGPESATTQGTDLAAALSLAGKLFTEPGQAHQAIVLLSDGEEHEAPAATVAKQLQQQGITILSVGFGTPAGGTIMDPETGATKKDKSGQTIVTVLESKVLEEISQLTKGSFIYFTDLATTGKQLNQQLNALGTKAYGTAAGAEGVSLVPWCGLLAIIASILSFLPRPTRWKRTPNIAMTLLLIWIVSPSHAQNINAALKAGDWASAAGAYEQLAKNQPNFIHHYQHGVCLALLGNWPDAQKGFEAALPLAANPEQKAKAAYNLALAHAKQQQWQDAANGFKLALQQQPTDQDAAFNYAYCLQQMKAQSKPKQQQQKNPQIEQLLKQLEQRERETRQQLKQLSVPSPKQPEKDW